MRRLVRFARWAGVQGGPVCRLARSAGWAEVVNCLRHDHDPKTDGSLQSSALPDGKAWHSVPLWSSPVAIRKRTVAARRVKPHARKNRDLDSPTPHIVPFDDKTINLALSNRLTEARPGPALPFRTAGVTTSGSLAPDYLPMRRNTSSDLFGDHQARGSQAGSIARSSEVAELLATWGRVIREHEKGSPYRGFTLSIQRARLDREWVPSQALFGLMKRLVSDLRVHGSTGTGDVLIWRDGR